MLQIREKLFLVLVASLLVFSCSTGKDEVPTVKLAYMLTMNPAEGRAEVEEKLNELMMEAVGVKVELVYIEFGNWASQLNLLLADGSIDLFNNMFMSPLGVLVDNDQIVKMDKYLDDYGKDIKGALGDYLDCTQVDGSIYGVPNLHAFAIRDTYYLNKEMNNKIGYDISKIHDWESLTEFMTTAQQFYPDKIMIPTGSGGGYLGPVNVDSLGSTNTAFGVLLNGGENLDVVNYYESQDFLDILEYAWQWRDAGFLPDDPLNSQDGSNAYLKSGLALGALNLSHEASAGASVISATTGVELLGVNLNDSFASTDTVASWSWCISSTSKNQVAAMKVLNELYSNPEIADLVCSGIEGVHYKILDNGTIDFIDGLDAFTTSWPSGMGTFWPNVTITRPWAPNPPDFYLSWVESNKKTKKSAAMGFTFDFSPVSNEIAACTNVHSQYYNSLMVGAGDRESLLLEFQQALRDAGIDRIVAEKQRQLDLWASGRK